MVLRKSIDSGLVSPLGCCTALIRVSLLN